MVLVRSHAEQMNIHPRATAEAGAVVGLLGQTTVRKTDVLKLAFGPQRARVDECAELDLTARDAIDRVGLPGRHVLDTA